MSVLGVIIFRQSLDTNLLLEKQQNNQAGPQRKLLWGIHSIPGAEEPLAAAEGIWSCVEQKSCRLLSSAGDFSLILQNLPACGVVSADLLRAVGTQPVCVWKQGGLVFDDIGAAAAL